MGAIVSQITSLTIVYSTLYSEADKKKSKLCVTGPCVRNSPVAGEFPTQMASNAENVSIWWRHHEIFFGLKRHTMDTIRAGHYEPYTNKRKPQSNFIFQQN